MRYIYFIIALIVLGCSTPNKLKTLSGTQLGSDETWVSGFCDTLTGEKILIQRSELIDDCCYKFIDNNWTKVECENIGECSSKKIYTEELCYHGYFYYYDNTTPSNGACGLVSANYGLNPNETTWISFENSCDNYDSFTGHTNTAANLNGYFDGMNQYLTDNTSSEWVWGLDTPNKCWRYFSTIAKEQCYGTWTLDYKGKTVTVDPRILYAKCEITKKVCEEKLPDGNIDMVTSYYDANDSLLLDLTQYLIECTGWDPIVINKIYPDNKSVIDCLTADCTYKGLEESEPSCPVNQYGPLCDWSYYLDTETCTIITPDVYLDVDCFGEFRYYTVDAEDGVTEYELQGTYGNCDCTEIDTETPLPLCGDETGITESYLVKKNFKLVESQFDPTITGSQTVDISADFGLAPGSIVATLDNQLWTGGTGTIAATSTTNSTTFSVSGTQSVCIRAVHGGSIPLDGGSDCFTSNDGVSYTFTGNITGDGSFTDGVSGCVTSVTDNLQGGIRWESDGPATSVTLSTTNTNAFNSVRFFVSICECVDVREWISCDKKTCLWLDGKDIVDVEGLEKCKDATDAKSDCEVENNWCAYSAKGELLLSVQKHKCFNGGDFSVSWYDAVEDTLINKDDFIIKICDGSNCLVRDRLMCHDADCDGTADEQFISETRICTDAEGNQERIVKYYTNESYGTANEIEFVPTGDIFPCEDLGTPCVAICMVCANPPVIIKPTPVRGTIKLIKTVKAVKTLIRKLGREPTEKELTTLMEECEAEALPCKNGSKLELTLCGGNITEAYLDGVLQDLPIDTSNFKRIEDCDAVISTEPCQYNYVREEICIVQDTIQCSAIREIIKCDQEAIDTTYSSAGVVLDSVKEIDCDKCITVACPVYTGRGSFLWTINTTTGPISVSTPGNTIPLTQIDNYIDVDDVLVTAGLYDDRNIVCDGTTADLGEVQLINPSLEIISIVVGVSENSNSEYFFNSFGNCNFLGTTIIQESPICYKTATNIDGEVVVDSVCNAGYRLRYGNGNIAYQDGIGNFLSLTNIKLVDCSCCPCGSFCEEEETDPEGVCDVGEEYAILAYDYGLNGADPDGCNGDEEMILYYDGVNNCSPPNPIPIAGLTQDGLGNTVVTTQYPTAAIVAHIKSCLGANTVVQFDYRLYGGGFANPPIPPPWSGAICSGTNTSMRGGVGILVNNYTTTPTNSVEEAAILNGNGSDLIRNGAKHNVTIGKCPVPTSSSTRRSEIKLTPEQGGNE